MIGILDRTDIYASLIWHHKRMSRRPERFASQALHQRPSEWRPCWLLSRRPGSKGQGVIRAGTEIIDSTRNGARDAAAVTPLGNRRLGKRIMNGYLWSALILAALSATLPIAAAWLASRGSRGVADVRTMFLAIAVATPLSLSAIACGIIGLMI